MRYQFLKDVTVQGVAYKTDDIIDETAIPLGSLECLMNDFVGQYSEPAAIIETTEPASEPAAEIQNSSISPKRKGK